jgi:hypothetical protein
MIGCRCKATRRVEDSEDWMVVVEVVVVWE